MLGARSGAVEVRRCFVRDQEAARAAVWQLPAGPHSQAEAQLRLQMRDEITAK